MQFLGMPNKWGLMSVINTTCFTIKGLKLLLNFKFFEPKHILGPKKNFSHPDVIYLVEHFIGKLECGSAQPSLFIIIIYNPDVEVYIEDIFVYCATEDQMFTLLKMYFVHCIS